ncbi:MAG TPA: hypothetical protein VIX86_26055 [Streptosporangiaceae bacterium]
MSGLLLLLLGIWGALVPLLGPYFHYAYTPDTAWTVTSARVWLEIAPGAVVALAGIILMSTASRPVAMLAAELAAVAGAWFALGALLSPLWAAPGTVNPGSPVGGTDVSILERLGFFLGLGVVIVFIAALALGRLTVIGVRDARLARGTAETVTEPEPEPEPEPVTVGAGSAAASDTTQTTAGRNPARSISRWLPSKS